MDAAGRFFDDLVFPDSHGGPACCLEICDILAISLPGPFELGQPVPLVDGRIVAVHGAAVPKTAVHENRHASAREDDVWANPATVREINAQVAPVPQPCRMQRRPECAFGTRIAAPVGLHVDTPGVVSHATWGAISRGGSGGAAGRS
jgi:hypothetical protein